MPGPAAPGPAALLRADDPLGRIVLVTTVLGSGVAFLDGTIVNVALPTIGRDLGAALSGLQWVISGYALTLAALILLGGSLGDRLGRRRAYIWGVAGFGVASALCGLSPNIQTLVGARALQGAAAALLTPGSLAILQSSFHPEDRMRVIGIWTGALSIAAATGPLAGGWLIGYDWRWAFWVNVPICAGVGVLAARYVPESRNPAASRTIDVPGVLLGALGLAGLTYALTAWPDHGLDTMTVAAGGGGVMALVAFVLTERRAPHPILPISLFSSRTFSVINLVTFAVYAALSGVFLFLTLFLQVVWGWPAIQAGAATLPLSFVMLVLAGRFGALGARIGARPLLIAGPLAAATGLVVLSLAPDHPSYVLHVLPGVLLLGLGLAMTVAPLTGTVLAAAPDELAGTASGVNNAVSRTAGLMAVAALPAIVGLSGNKYAEAASLAPAYRMAL
ncbi:MAG TPA: DHA2 family efflux MFS transporter permease subunit, partial [Streptosporangiaceae bacterium]|nr:DHA2 family efflux MFS transporter permease subunit [Streptosporangiaceae bacterium]